jgi:hypothetical protein
MPFYLILILISFVAFPGDQNYFDVCHNSYTFGTSIPFKGTPEKSIFISDCAPDTLYSWQKSSRMSLAHFSKTPLVNGKFLYTWRTPLGTFGYGDIQIRIKLKEDVKFRWVKVGEQFCPKDDQENTVYVHAYPFGAFILNAVDYILCSKGPVESWSAGTKGAYLESMNELNYISTSAYEHPQPYDSYGIGLFRSKPIPRNVFYPDNPYFISWDNDRGHDWSEKSLLEKINNIKLKKNDFQRKIFCKKKDCQIQDHFISTKKNYFQLSEEQLRKHLREML